MIIKELADYCLKCQNPSCVKGCPIHNDIPSIMNYVSSEQYHEAYRELLKTQIMPELCGSLCAHDHQCEGQCVRGIKGKPVEIGKVEYLLSNMYKGSYLQDLPVSKKAKDSKTAAIVGAGITGITISLILARAGVKVILFDKEKKIGGTIDKFVPNFRYLSNTFLDFDSVLRKLNVKICLEYELGRNLSIKDLEKYDFQIICTGAQIPINIWNENFPSCFYGLDILEAYNQNKCKIKERNIIVIGAGNVAMDTARALKRLKNNVTIVYRRNIENSPASKKELQATLNEGVNLAELWTPIQPIVKNEVLIGLQVQKMRLTEKEKDKRQNVIPIEGAISCFPCDTIVMATGAKSNKDCFANAHISTKNDNYLNYYFGGDFFTGPKTIVEAIASGKKIANAVIDRINNFQEIKKIIKNSKKKVFFGGSFNPPTLAHQNILKLLTEQLDTEVLLVPNSDDYHYHNKQLLSFDERIAMLKLLIKNISNVELITSEKNREFKGSVETLKEYNHPWFVIGADSLSFITTWIDAKKLIKQNNFIVLNRSGFNIEEIFKSNKLLNNYRNRFLIVDYEIGDISSSDFRNTFNQNLLPNEIYDYIIKNNLYKENQNEEK